MMNKKNKMQKLFRSILYSYPGYISYYYTQRLSGFKKERQHIHKKIGYYPDYRNPKSFNEKIFYKKVYDRNPLLPITSDKYRVREYIRNCLGESEAESILVPLLYVTDKPETIPFDSLIEDYVIKPNHSSGKIILAEIVDGKRIYRLLLNNSMVTFDDSKSSKADIIELCKSWLSKPYAFRHHEWAYQKIKRKIIIEKLLHNSDGRIASEYKINVFNGKCNDIVVVHNRFREMSQASYSPEWEPIKSLNSRKNIREAENEKKPKNLEYMIKLAEKLAKSFDYVRVDLYRVNVHLYFGELTHYTASGAIPFNPISHDYELGLKWKIIPGYWKIFKN